MIAAVTGMGAICAAGLTPEAIFGKTRQGGLLPSRMDFFPIAPGTGAAPDECPVFTLPDTIFPNGRRNSASDILHVSLLAAEQAIEQAGLPAGPEYTEQSGRIGVIMGTTAGCALHFIRGYAKQRNGSKERQPDIDDFFLSNPALALAARYHFQGPCITVANACTSGTDAIGLGLEFIASGRCDAVICGGADIIDLVPHTGFSRLMIYDHAPCRPFDFNRNGLNLGEGAGVLVLEQPDQATKRGASILGEIQGYGTSSDAHHLTSPDPEGKGLASAINAAMVSAGIKADDLAFINAHGTGTHENDKSEGATLARILPDVPVWASKGSTGHTLGAAGALEAILCLEALRHGVLPKSHGFRTPDPETSLVPTIEETSIAKNHAMSTSLGFGGGNSALILGGVR